MTGPRYQVRIAARPLEARFELKGALAALTTALAAAGLALPGRPNTFVLAGIGARVAWLGPDRVHVCAPLAAESGLSAALESAVADAADADVALVSDMVAAFDISGPGARDVLAQGTATDLDPDRFPPGSASGIEIWSLAALLERYDGVPDRFVLAVDRSLGPYLELWLRTAAGLRSDLQPGTMRAPPPPG